MSLMRQGHSRKLQTLPLSTIVSSFGCDTSYTSFPYGSIFSLKSRQPVLANDQTEHTIWLLSSHIAGEFPDHLGRFTKTRPSTTTLRKSPTTYLFDMPLHLINSDSFLPANIPNLGPVNSNKRNSAHEAHDRGHFAPDIISVPSTASLKRRREANGEPIEEPHPKKARVLGNMFQDGREDPYAEDRHSLNSKVTRWSSAIELHCSVSTKTKAFLEGAVIEHPAWARSRTCDVVFSPTQVVKDPSNPEQTRKACFIRMTPSCSRVPTLTYAPTRGVYLRQQAEELLDNVLELAGKKQGALPQQIDRDTATSKLNTVSSVPLRRNPKRKADCR